MDFDLSEDVYTTPMTDIIFTDLDNSYKHKYVNLDRVKDGYDEQLPIMHCFK